MYPSHFSNPSARSQPSSLQGPDDDTMEDIEHIGIISQHKPALKSVSEYVKNTLLLLKQVPVPEDDPLSIVPKEIDYYEDSSKDGYNAAVNLFGIQRLDPSIYYAEARRELNTTWLSVERKSESIEQVSILSANGEISFREGDYTFAKTCYTQALHIMEKLAGEDKTRVADLNVKICICLQIGGNAEEAIEHCIEATTIYQARLKKLIAESIESSCSATSNDPILAEKKKLEKRKLTSILSDLVFKLDELKEQRNGPSGRPMLPKSALQQFLKEQLRGSKRK